MKPTKHSRDHSVFGEDPIPVVMHIKIFSDTTIVTVGDDARRWTVGREFHLAAVRTLHGTVTTASSSGQVEFQVHNINTGTDLLNVTTTIDANETQSWNAFAQHDINTTGDANVVHEGDVLRFDIDSAGTGAKGLEVWVELGPKELAF